MLTADASSMRVAVHRLFVCRIECKVETRELEFQTVNLLHNIVRSKAERRDTLQLTL